jgi:hypothetical protein
MELPTYDLTELKLDLMTEIQLNLPPEELDAAIASLSPQARAVLRGHCQICAQHQADIVNRIERLSKSTTAS